MGYFTRDCTTDTMLLALLVRDDVWTIHIQNENKEVERDRLISLEDVHSYAGWIKYWYNQDLEDFERETMSNNSVSSLDKDELG